MKQVFLVIGADASWVGDEREALIERFVSKEMRDENLLELYATSSRDLKLDDVCGQVVSELATIPFLPDSKRVVVLHNLADFLGGGRSKGGGRKKASGAGGKKKRTSVEMLEMFMKNDLPATGNVLIFSSVVDPLRGKYVDRNSPLRKMLDKSDIAQVMLPPQKEKDPLFEMSDAILARRTPAALKAFRAVYSNDTQTRVFNEMLKVVRFLIQADVIGRLSEGGMSADRARNRVMPDNKTLSLLDQPDWVVKKYRGAAMRFQLRQSMAALERLLEIQRVLFPSSADTYVPDLRMMLETFIVEFCEGAMRKSA